MSPEVDKGLTRANTESNVKSKNKNRGLDGRTEEDKERERHYRVPEATYKHTHTFIHTSIHTSLCVTNPPLTLSCVSTRTTFAPQFWASVRGITSSAEAAALKAHCCTPSTSCKKTKDKRQETKNDKSKNNRGAENTIHRQEYTYVCIYR